MPTENVEIVRRLFDAFRRRDYEYPFTVLAEDIEWDVRAITFLDFGGRIYRGHEGVREFWRRWLQAWSEIDFEVEKMVESGDEVAALMKQRNRAPQRDLGGSAALRARLRVPSGQGDPRALLLGG